jgi:hypothetical protein
MAAFDRLIIAALGGGGGLVPPADQRTAIGLRPADTAPVSLPERDFMMPGAASSSAVEGSTQVTLVRPPGRSARAPRRRVLVGAALATLAFAFAAPALYYAGRAASGVPAPNLPGASSPIAAPPSPVAAPPSPIAAPPSPVAARPSPIAAAASPVTARPSAAPSPPGASSSALPARAHASSSAARTRARHPPAEPATGWLTLDTRPWGTVYLDGRRLGVTPFARVQLPAGKHRLIIDLEDSGRRRPLPVQVAAHAETRLTLQLR